MPEFQIRADDFQAKSLLGNLRKKLQGLDPLVEKIGARFSDSIEESFDNLAAPDDSPWAALAPSTVNRKRRLGQSLKPLQASGAGKKSVRVIVSGKTIRIVYADHMDAHQLGTKRIPKRQFAPTPNDLTSETTLGQQVLKETQTYLFPKLGDFIQGELRRLR